MLHTLRKPVEIEPAPAFKRAAKKGGSCRGIGQKNAIKEKYWEHEGKLNGSILNTAAQGILLKRREIESLGMRDFNDYDFNCEYNSESVYIIHV